jgi:hypothetical protein
MHENQNNRYGPRVFRARRKASMGETFWRALQITEKKPAASRMLIDKEFEIINPGEWQ